jgi:hypothetical protein
MCARMLVHTQTVFITYATQVHTADTRYIMAITQYHFSNFAGPHIFMGTSIINNAIFLIDNLMVRRTVE